MRHPFGVAVLMMFASLACVVQLAGLASWTRSIRIRTLLVAAAAGCYGVGTLALGLELLWTRGYALVSGQPLITVVQRAGYTVDPVIEEVVKLLPVLIVVTFCRSRRQQWGVTDYFLLGGALGAGFGLLEALLRFGGRASHAVASDHGYTVVTGIFSSTDIPGLRNALGTWLPAPAASGDVLGIDHFSHLNLHVAYSAVAAFGIGVVLRVRGPRRWLGALPFLCACLDHAAYNFDLRQSGQSGLLIGGLMVLHRALWLWPVAALVVAVLLDRRTLRTGREIDPALLTQEEASHGWGALVRFARLRPPWTVLVLWRFVLLRRTSAYAAALPGNETRALHAGVAKIAKAIDLAHDPAGWRRARSHLSLRHRSLRVVLQERRIVVWIVLVAPVILFYIIGGLPLFSVLQKWLSYPIATTLIVVLVVGASIWTACRSVTTVRLARRAAREPWVEPVVRAGLKLSVGLGSIAGGVALLAIWASGNRNGMDRVVSSYHVLEALGDALMLAAFVLALAALFMFPPLALVAIEGAGSIFVVTMSAELAAGAAAAAALGTSGYLLAEAANGYSPGETTEPRPSRSTRSQRLEELSRDAAHNGKTTPGSIREAEVGLEMEERGALDGPITRSSKPSADLRDANGQDWDVKGYHSERVGRGAFDADRAYSKITQEVEEGNGVILDTKFMSAEHIDELRSLLDANPGVSAMVKWW